MLPVGVISLFMWGLLSGGKRNLLQTFDTDIGPGALASEGRGGNQNPTEGSTPGPAFFAAGHHEMQAGPGRVFRPAKVIRVVGVPAVAIDGDHGIMPSGALSRHARDW